MGMSIDEVRDLKRETERRIGDLLTVFGAKAGVAVDHLDLDRIDETDMDDDVPSYRYRARLRVSLD